MSSIHYQYSLLLVRATKKRHRIFWSNHGRYKGNKKSWKRIIRKGDSKIISDCVDRHENHKTNTHRRRIT